MEPVELILRGAVFALALAVAAATLARLPRTAAARAAAFALGGIGAFVVSSAPGSLRSVGLAVFFFDAWCMATPAVVWILAAMLFRDGFQLRAWHLAAMGAFVVPTFAGDWGRFGLGPLGSWPQLSEGLLLAGRAGALACLAGACWHAASHWRDDLVEARRRSRLLFVLAIAGVFATLAASDFVFNLRGAPQAARLAGHAALLALLFALLVCVARGALDELLSPAPGPAAPDLVVVGPDTPPPRARLAGVRSEALEAALARRVVEAMESGRLWKRERLGIAALAGELRTQEHLLRRAINRHLGYRNFNDFLHDWRLREAAQRLASAEQRALPVLSIALDCGYGSIGPFNRAFKARFGVTPTQYRHLKSGEKVAAPEFGQLAG